MEKGEKIIKIHPIGHVRNDFKDEIPKDYENHHSEIVLKPEFSGALDHIEYNSHIVVLFWMDKIVEEKRKTFKLHPKGREDLPLVGVFATRSPVRPNPIGVRAVKLEKREDNVLEVLGLDAFNDSPVLDIKPYSLKHDFVENARPPPWEKHLRKEKG